MVDYACCNDDPMIVRFYQTIQKVESAHRQRKRVVKKRIQKSHTERTVGVAVSGGTLLDFSIPGDSSGHSCDVASSKKISVGHLHRMTYA